MLKGVFSSIARRGWGSACHNLYGERHNFPSKGFLWKDLIAMLLKNKSKCQTEDAQMSNWVCQLCKVPEIKLNELPNIQVAIFSCWIKGTKGWRRPVVPIFHNNVPPSTNVMTFIAPGTQETFSHFDRHLDLCNGYGNNNYMFGRIANENLNSQDGRAGVGIPERIMRTGMRFGAFDIENKHSEIK